MFILSKILLFLLNPLFWICLAFLLSWIIKKPVWKKRLRITAVILLLVFSNPFLINKVLTDLQATGTVAELGRAAGLTYLPPREPAILGEAWLKTPQK